MQAVDKEVLGQILEWLRAGQSCWLATVVQTWGSSPRPEGSLLACNREGHISGSLSGGCVEDDLLEKLVKGELAADGAQFFQYGITAEETEKLGLPCGGHLYIVVEPQQPDDETIAHFVELNAALDERRCITRMVNLQTQVTSIEPAEGHAPLKWDEQQQTLTHVYGPRHQLFIIGAGMVSKYLADMAGVLDYEVTVCDPREDLLGAFNVAGVRKLNDMPDDAIRAHAKDPATAIVALTHDPRIDDMGLMEALTTDAFYIGAMGSSRTSANRRERLLALDLSPAEIDKLHAPIGLPIGSKTPPEIAIAILAEITAVRKNRLAEVRAEVQAISAG
ncbi:MAG: XdhC family protein [Pseudomonadales bacterium]